jgi:hypothetical protein
MLVLVVVLVLVLLVLLVVPVLLVVLPAASAGPSQWLAPSGNARGGQFQFNGAQSSH